MEKTTIITNLLAEFITKYGSEVLKELEDEKSSSNLLLKRN